LASCILPAPPWRFAPPPGAESRANRTESTRRPNEATCVDRKCRLTGLGLGRPESDSTLVPIGSPAKTAVYFRAAYGTAFAYSRWRRAPSVGRGFGESRIAVLESRSRLATRRNTLARVVGSVLGPLSTRRPRLTSMTRNVPLMGKWTAASGEPGPCQVVRLFAWAGRGGTRKEIA
jgi:hypothetical protein